MQPLAAQHCRYLTVGAYGGWILTQCARPRLFYRPIPGGVLFAEHPYRPPLHCREYRAIPKDIGKLWAYSPGVGQGDMVEDRAAIKDRAPNIPRLLCLEMRPIEVRRLQMSG